MKKIIILFLLLVSCAPQRTLLATPSIQSRINVAVSGDIITVTEGDYPEYVLMSKDGITLEAVGKVTVKMFEVSGNNNVIRGFTVTDPQSKVGFRVYGNNNLIENNEVFWMLEDGFWLAGSNNIIRGNNIHDILAPGKDVNDPHVDCFMLWNDTWWTSDPIDNVVIENNFCENPRASGSNQIFILTRNNKSLPITNVIIRNNVFVVADGGYNPIAFFGDATITGVQITGNKFYNSNTGANPVYLSNMAGVVVENNTAYGWAGPFVKLVNSSAMQSNNVLFPYPTPTEIPTITPTNTPTVTPTFTPAPKLCIKIVWTRNVSIRPDASIDNEPIGYYYTGKIIRVEAILTNGAGTWAQINAGQFTAVRIGTRVYGKVVGC